jgi:hypothetical protein
MAARKRGRDELDLVDAPPRADAYTGMLAIAFVAAIIGLVFLYLDWSDYSGKGVPDPKGLSQELARRRSARPPLADTGLGLGADQADKAKSGTPSP